MKLILSDEEFEAMSRRAEQELKHNRSVYMLKVMGLAALGYAFIFGVVALLLIVLFWLIYLLINSPARVLSFKVIALFLIPLAAIGKSLWLKVPEPKGIAVTRNEVPELFAVIKDLSKKLHTRVDCVLLDDQYNAAVLQIPRLGFLGFHKNILMIGLPLMLTLRPDEFKAVLAHELGHLSGNHSRSSAWIYKLRGRWGTLLNTIGKAGSLFFALFLIFFSWFSPRFNAYSLALARAHELEADANAAKICGANSFTQSMLSLPVYGQFLGKTFWPGVRELLKSRAQPPEDIFVRLKNEVAKYAPDQELIKQTLAEAMSEKSSGADTHPPLKVRLLEGYFTPVLQQDEHGGAQTDYEGALDLPLTTEKSAAGRFLGTGLEGILRQLSMTWQISMGAGWRYEHEIVQKAVANLKAVEEKEATSGLTIDELKLKAYLIGQTQDEKDCIDVYNEILMRAPEDQRVRFNLGMLIVKDDLDEGIETSGTSN